jgi:hypothetical protein
VKYAWVKVFRIFPDFRIFWVLSDRFCDSCKSVEKIVRGVGGSENWYYHFYLASGMFLSTVKGVIFNLVLLIYVGSCYFKPKCL